MPAETAAAAPAAAPTAFRAAEKAFQLHREAVPRCGGDPTRRRRGGTRWRVRDVDLGAVLDCGALAAEEAAAGSGSEQPCMPPAPHGGARRGARRVAAPGLPPGCAAYALDERPGAFVVVGALSAAEQARTLRSALTHTPPLARRTRRRSGRRCVFANAPKRRRPRTWAVRWPTRRVRCFVACVR